MSKVFITLQDMCPSFMPLYYYIPGLRMNNAHLIRKRVIAADVQFTLGGYDHQTHLETLVVARWRSEWVYKALDLCHVFSTQILLLIKLGVELKVRRAPSDYFDLYNDNCNPQLFVFYLQYKAAQKNLHHAN